MSEENGTGEQAREKPFSRPTGKTATILIVEDEEIILNLARMVLKGAGFSVLTALDGEEALEVFSAHSNRIDLVLLDMMLPKISGLALYEKMVAMKPGTRFIFSSGYSETRLPTLSEVQFKPRIIQKPYMMDQLLAEVRQILETVS